MPRMAIASGLLLILWTCTGDDPGPATVPAARILVDDAGGNPFQPRVSPDGTRLAWSKPVDGQSAVFVGNADGSDPVRLTQGVWDAAPVWSPDGRWIAYHAEAPDYDVFVVPSEGGEPRQLTSGPAIDFPRYWLPDGSAVVVYREGAGPVQTIAVPFEGGNARPLMPPDAGNAAVVLSPDVSRAAIGLMRAGERTIWVRDESSGETRQLTREGMETLGDYPWSPDGRFLLYESRRTGTSDIWIADVETSELRQLTTDIHDDRDARWSPDGRWIAFQSDRGGQADLWIVAAAGGQPHRVTDDLAAEREHEWSPDGESLIYSSLDGTHGLQALPLDGGPPRELVGWPVYGIESVDITPDGQTIVFQSNRSGNNDLWSIPFAGGEPIPLTTSPVDDDEPQLSPDGRTVAFHSHRAGSGDLWLMPTAGGETTQLTDWPSNEQGARWSPDGRLIAFTSDRDSDRLEVWVTPAAGGDARRLTNDLGNAEDLRWSPDGSELYFVGVTSTGIRDLYRVALNGGEPEPLGASRNIGVGDLSPDGLHYAYAAFESGWGYIDVIPTAGGAARRLTTRTERVFQSDVLWSPDGQSLVIVDYDFPEDSEDLDIVTWPGGEWRPLTSTPPVNERPHVFTPDGSHLLVTAVTTRARIMAVNVTDLLADAAGR